MQNGAIFCTFLKTMFKNFQLFTYVVYLYSVDQDFVFNILSAVGGVALLILLWANPPSP